MSAPGAGRSLNIIDPDLISLTASSADSQTFDLLGTGALCAVAYVLTAEERESLKRPVEATDSLHTVTLSMLKECAIMEVKGLEGKCGDGETLEAYLCRVTFNTILVGTFLRFGKADRRPLVLQSPGAESRLCPNRQ